jgi:hypothetical protein
MLKLQKNYVYQMNLEYQSINIALFVSTKMFGLLNITKVL